MRFPFFLFLCACFSLQVRSLAQNSVHLLVKDEHSKEPIPGVVLLLKGTSNAVYSGTNGAGTLTNIPDGDQVIVADLVTYKSVELRLHFPLADTTAVQTIYLAQEGNELGEVIVSSSRTNSRIDDLNTKVEVLGQEEMNEESTIVPGNVASILGDISIITVQRTNVINGNDAIRMQGLDPRYTQIMRDGLPLYDGFSGSLGVLAIPPLDLKQVEIIKGSASTLYGGGAIGGLINFISKTPDDSAKTTFILNTTSLKEYNLNAFTSNKKSRIGYTLFAGANYKTPVDINGDGFAEIAQQRNLLMHPRLFVDINERNKLVIGITSNFDERKGGDIYAIEHAADSIHPFLQEETNLRNSLDLAYNSNLTKNNNLTFKAAGSAFQRELNYSGFAFRGTQYSSYSELNDYFEAGKHKVVIGANLVTQQFKLDPSDAVLFHSTNFQTFGAFLQDDWQFAPKLSLQTGLRVDHHSRYGDFYLPRLALFYKPNSNLSVRLAGGTGYKVPDNFDFAGPESNLMDVPLPPSIKPEHSYGVNGDVSYHTVLFQKISFQVDEALYYTRINDPLYLRSNAAGNYFLSNAGYTVNSYGTDTYLRFVVDELEVYVGYNHTESLQETDSTYSNVPFNPKDKFSTTIAYDTEKHWRMGIEASWTGNQTVYDNRRVPSFLFMAAMVEYRVGKVGIVLNCENLLDVRQSQYEPIVSGTRSNPVFAPAWAPMEGRVLNLSFKLTI